MSDSNQTLRTALETSDMLVIDGLHAWDFSLDDVQLLIKCMDGRAEKRWHFTAPQIDAAVFDQGLQSWTLTGDSGEHRLVCLSALSANNDDDDTEVTDEVKNLPMLMALSVGAMSAQAESRNEVELLVGSYTQGKSQGIYRLQFDSDKGRIAPEPLQVFKAANPSWLTLSRDQTRLFVVNENGKGQADVVGRASSVAIDPKTNALTLINQVKTLGEEPTHSSLSADERYLFVANYGVHADPGGSLAVLPINAEGQLQPVTQMSSHPASKVNPERQMSAHVHSVVSSPDGKFVYASDLGADKVFVYRYDPAANPEHPLVAAEPAFIELPPGSGPRHLLFSKDGKHAYLTTEMSAQVFVFDYDNGRLKQRQALELAKGMPAQNRAAGAVHASADGKFLYVSNRGKANEILVFAINPDNGELSEIQRRSVDGDHPREFALSPNGKFLLIANQMSNAIVVLERDPATGKLGKTVQTLAMDAPSDVKFINRP